MEPNYKIVVPVMCDCCGKEKLAEIKEGKLVIYDTRHGQRHFVVLDIQKLAGSAIVELTNLTRVV